MIPGKMPSAMFSLAGSSAHCVNRDPACCRCLRGGELLLNIMWVPRTQIAQKVAGGAPVEPRAIFRSHQQLFCSFRGAHSDKQNGPLGTRLGMVKATSGRMDKTAARQLRQML